MQSSTCSHRILLLPAQPTIRYEDGAFPRLLAYSCAIAPRFLDAQWMPFSVVRLVCVLELVSGSLVRCSSPKSPRARRRGRKLPSHVRRPGAVCLRGPVEPRLSDQSNQGHRQLAAGSQCDRHPVRHYFRIRCARGNHHNHILSLISTRLSLVLSFFGRYIVVADGFGTISLRDVRKSTSFTTCHMPAFFSAR